MNERYVPKELIGFSQLKNTLYQSEELTIAQQAIREELYDLWSSDNAYINGIPIRLLPDIILFDETRAHGKAVPWPAFDDTSEAVLQIYKIEGSEQYLVNYAISEPNGVYDFQDVEKLVICDRFLVNFKDGIIDPRVLRFGDDMPELVADSPIVWGYLANILFPEFD